MAYDMPPETEFQKYIRLTKDGNANTSFIQTIDYLRKFHLGPLQSDI